jgi:carboxyl-terminal processing protease
LGVELRTLKLLLVCAMGFCLGMVLAGVGGLSAETFLHGFNRYESSKNLEKFWSETGVGLTDVESFISNKKCRSIGKYHEACVNAIAQTLAATGLKITTDGLSVEAYSDSNRFEEMTEKEIASAYSGIKIDFDSVTAALFRRYQAQQKSKIAGYLINGFLSVYFDAHSYIVPTDYYSQVTSKVERSKFFVGLSYERKDGEFFVQKIAKNSDAEKAGLKIGDRIVSIDGRKLKNLGYSEVRQILRDENKKSLRFYLERKKNYYSLVVKRSYRLLSHAQHNYLGKEKRYSLLTVSKFSNGICDEVKSILKNITESQNKGLILDLRDNPGGLLSESACLAGLFLGRNKKAYYIEFFNDELPNEVVLTDQDQIYEGPLVVLINSRSASSAETLTGALQDYKRALVMGRRSFGKGTFQESEPWLLNDKITFFKTRGMYLLPSRNSTQLQGLTPDMILASDKIEKREADFFVNPIRLKTKKYGSLKATEITDDKFVQNFYKNKCREQLDIISGQNSDLSGADDFYISTSISALDCGIGDNNKLSVAEGSEKTLN